MRNFCLSLCYDGSRYRGWQKQGNTHNTIQEKLETLLSRLLEQPIEIAGSGRTDAGVHAVKQVCSFHAETDISCEKLLREIRNYLPEDIGALSLENAAPRFHARLNCKKKTYLYRIWNSSSPDVFERKYRYSVPEVLDLDSMKNASELLLGEHDFLAFSSEKRIKKSTVRILDKIEFVQKGDELQIYLTGNGFLYNMVRIIVGTLLEVGTGKRTVSSVTDALSSLSRSLAGYTVPPHGLYLYNLKY